ncbi:MAG: hypothetical protein SFW67_12060 [Myxococcaceae bacterium]|nr:hypothetical protein [Myxococcaceae bacterium]
MKSHALAVGVLAVFFLAIAPSCGPATCSATSCAMGCCDSMGRCQAGTMQSACGKEGMACAACAPGQACTLQICGGPMAAGGGSGGGFMAAGGNAGGVAGGSAAMDSGCPVVDDVVVNEPAFASFNVGEPDSGLEDFDWWSTEVGFEEPGPTYDFFTAELYFAKVDGPPMFPYAGTLPAMVTNGNCTECFYAALGCNEDGENCTRGSYLARAGAYDFARGTRNEAAGSFQAAGTNLVFEEWNFGADRAVQGGRCFTVPRLSFGGTWPDAPADGGAGDAGLVGDGGLRADAGPGQDAGVRDGGP